MFVLLAPACHIFESVTVECTADMPCATGGDADADADADSDADGDTDTGPTVGPVRGWAVSLLAGDKGHVRLYEPTGTNLVTEWVGYGAYAGAIEYDTRTGVAVMANGNDVILLQADGTSSVLAGVLADTARDVDVVQNNVLVAVGSDIYSVDPAGGHVYSLLDPGQVTSLNYLGGSPSIGFAVDLQDGTPDMFTWQSGLTDHVEDFDYTVGRANVFVGPGDQPHVCSAYGAIFDVGRLKSGDGTPLAVSDVGMSDVTDCAWDPGDSTWLLFSPTVGVVRLDGFGASNIVYHPPNGYQVGRVSFY